MTNFLPVRASVIIVSYNCREYLVQGLPSVLTSLGTNDELILVDNASCDGSAKSVQQAYPHVRVIVSEKNLGFGAASNLGVEQAAGEFVVFINPDTVVEPNWLEALIQALQANPEIQLVTSRIVLMQDPATINTCGNDVHISGITLCRGIGRSHDEYDTPGPVSAVSGAAFAMLRVLYQELGGFDPDFFLYMEDTDLSLRARLAGNHIAFVPGSIVQHAYELHFGPTKTYFQERNRYLMLLKLYHWRTLFALIPIFLLSEAVTWGYVLLREPDRLGNKFRAYAWIFKNWKQILSKRRQAQRLRQVPDRLLIAGTTSRLDITQVESGWLGSTANALFSALFAILKLWTRLWVWW
jgi:GT2 family glycosyltransferase